jgi:hypothetical protein
VSTHGATDDKVAEAHAKSSCNEKQAAGSSVDEYPHDTSENNEDGVLDTRCDHSNITSQARHLSDVSEIVYNDVCSGQLLLKQGTQPF